MTVIIILLALILLALSRELFLLFALGVAVYFLGPYVLGAAVLAWLSIGRFLEFAVLGGLILLCLWLIFAPIDKWLDKRSAARRAARAAADSARMKELLGSKDWETMADGEKRGIER